jgi:hypothetical protein
VTFASSTQKVEKMKLKRRTALSTSLAVTVDFCPNETIFSLRGKISFKIE